MAAKAEFDSLRNIYRIAIEERTARAAQIMNEWKAEARMAEEQAAAAREAEAAAAVNDENAAEWDDPLRQFLNEDE